MKKVTMNWDFYQELLTSAAHATGLLRGLDRIVKDAGLQSADVILPEEIAEHLSGLLDTATENHIITIHD